MSYSEQQKLSGLIREAIVVLSNHVLSDIRGFRVDGVLQFITDTKQAFKIDINETYGMKSEELTSLKEQMNIQEKRTIGPDSEKAGNIFKVISDFGLSYYYMLQLFQFV